VKPKTYIGPDTTREYRTRSGDRVIIHECVPHNSCGDRVTFPIKGTVIKASNPRIKRFNIWTTEGRDNTFSESPMDIIDMPPVLGLAPAPCLDCAPS
jgi:hypothetical protein